MNYEILKADFNEYLTDNNLRETDIAIHCDTQEKAEILINVFNLMRKAWSANAPLLLVNENNRPVTRWNKEKSATCYRVKETEPQFIAKGNINFYQNRNDVIIVEFTDLFPSIVNELTETAEIPQETEKTKKKFGLFSSKKEEVVITDIDKAEKILEEQGYEVHNIDVTESAESSTFNPNQSNTNPEDYLYLGSDETNVKEEVNKVLEKTQLNEENVANSKITDFIPEYTPFTVEGLSNRRFMFNDLGIREEEKLPDFWVKCDCEWELSYILMNLDKIHLEK